MIDIRFYRDESNILSVKMTGHAESGPYGYDLVCAAVSALSIGTVNSLIQLADIALDVDTADKEGGYLRFTLPKQLTKKQIETAQILLDSLFLSLSDTEKEYGEYLTVQTLNKK